MALLQLQPGTHLALRVFVEWSSQWELLLSFCLFFPPSFASQRKDETIVLENRGIKNQTKQPLHLWVDEEGNQCERKNEKTPKLFMSFLCTLDGKHSHILGSGQVTAVAFHEHGMGDVWPALTQPCGQRPASALGPHWAGAPWPSALSPLCFSY